jgi:PAS domain S-box-containing protein
MSLTSLPEISEPALLDRALVSAFLENIPDLVYFKDRESRFIAVSHSKARRHGLEPADLIGKTDGDFFSPTHAEWARVDEENIMATGTPVLGKLEKIAWPDGRVTWAVTSKLPLRDEGGEIIGTFGLTKDVTESKRLELELEKSQKELLGASRAAGMAEVATGVLHNVGNVLTSLNVSANTLATGLRDSKTGSLAKLAGLLREHTDDLGEFITADPKGRRVPEFIATLAEHFVAERERLLGEISSMQRNIDHIKEIVSMQQAYATMIGVTEPLDAAELLGDAIRMNAGALVRHEVGLVRDIDFVPPVVAERAKVLQILVNLIRNAKYACDEGGAAEKIITLRVKAAPANRVQISVVDNGVGIAPENLTRIFAHGFTTRKEGHGFGLHSSANAAKEMGGAVTVFSAGPGQGATFTLELPALSPVEIAGKA